MLSDNTKYDILLYGQIAALEIMPDCERFFSLDETQLNETLFTVMKNKIWLDKEYFGRIIVLASLALKKLKENDRA